MVYLWTGIEKQLIVSYMCMLAKKVIQYSNCCYRTLYHYVDSRHCCSILYIYTVLILDGILWQDVLCYLYVIYFASSYFLWMRKKMHLVKTIYSRSYIQRLQSTVECF